MSDTSYTWDTVGAEVEPVNPAHLDENGNWANAERAPYVEESFDVTQPPREDSASEDDGGDPPAETSKRKSAKADDSAAGDQQQ